MGSDSPCFLCLSRLCCLLLHFGSTRSWWMPCLNCSEPSARSFSDCLGPRKLQGVSRCFVLVGCTQTTQTTRSHQVSSRLVVHPPNCPHKDKDKKAIRWERETCHRQTETPQKQAKGRP